MNPPPALLLRQISLTCISSRAFWLILLNTAVQLRGQLELQIHDELVLECPACEEDLERLKVSVVRTKKSR